MVLLIAIVLGAIVGAVSSGEGGALAGALFGWLIVRSSRQQKEIESLRQRVETGGAAIAPPVLAAGEPGPASPATTSSLPLAPLPVATVPASAEVTYDRSDSPATQLPAPPATPPGPPRPRRPSVLAPVKAWFFGGNTIVKAGVGILFVGLAFLAKYATENMQVPVEFRLAAIGAAAVALLAFGWRLRLRRPDYAQVLQGGAIAVMYLTLFAAFRYFGVLSATPAFALMVAVAGLAAALAVLQDARALAFIGALGGFATPLIVSTGSDNYVALFAYYFVLDAGIAAVAWWKTWRPLNLLGFVATFLVATAWGVLKYRPEDFAISEAFLIAFFLLFVLILVLPARRAAAAPAPDGTPVAAPHAWVNSSLLFGLPTVVFALQYGLVQGTPFATAFSACVLGGFYVALAFWMRKRPELGLTFDASLAIATIFLTLVIPFALDERSTAGAWTLEGAGLVWIGLRQRRLLPRAFGYLLLFVAGAAMLFAYERYGDPTQLFNAYFFNSLMAAAASLAAAFFVRRARGTGALRGEEGIVEPILIGLATVWLASAAAVHIEALVAEPFVLAALVASVSAIAALYVGLAARLRWPTLTYPVVAHAPILLVAAVADAGLLANPAQFGGWWAWPLAFAVHAAVLRLAVGHWPALFAHAAHAVGAVAFALLGALLGRTATAGWGDAESAWPWLGWLVVPAALLLFLPRPSAARLWPIRDLPAAYRLTTASVLAFGLGLWTLVANIASDGSAAPLPHVPFLNPLDIGIGIALAAIFLWLRSAGLTERPAAWRVVLAAGAGFVWLNAVLVRAFHHYGGVPYRVDAWLGSLAVQTGITLLWTAMALATMWLGARRASRAPWVAGAALLGAVVLKLLIVDLSGSGSVTRIVSFIGVGVLMLVIGYVAPLPAKEMRHAAA